MHRREVVCYSDPDGVAAYHEKTRTDSDSKRVGYRTRTGFARVQDRTIRRCFTVSPMAIRTA